MDRKRGVGLSGKPWVSCVGRRDISWWKKSTWNKTAVTYVDKQVFDGEAGFCAVFHLDPVLVLVAV